MVRQFKSGPVLMLITSGRTFGVELELSARSQEDIHTLQGCRSLRGWRFDNDGSLRDNNVHNPIELVSPILFGDTGERAIFDMCKDLKELEFDASNKHCGFHVHNGAEEFKAKERTVVVDERGFNELVLKSGKQIKETSFVTEGFLKKYLDSTKLLTSHYRNIHRNHFFRLNAPIILRQDNDITLVASPETHRVGRKNIKHTLFSLLDGNKRGKFVVTVQDCSHLKKLLTLFLFYIIYDPVFMGMLPRSRRFGNAYCMSIGETFTPDEVLACKNQEDFEMLWYKERDKKQLPRRKNEHYNDSRYQNVNFHSLFNRHGTIEIRSHGATINPNKILLWTALHQLCIDKIASGEVKKSDILEARHLDIEDRAKHMICVLGPQSSLEKYIRRSLNYFSNINI